MRPRIVWLWGGTRCAWSSSGQSAPQPARKTDSMSQSKTHEPEQNAEQHRQKKPCRWMVTRRGEMHKKPCILHNPHYAKRKRRTIKLCALRVRIMRIMYRPPGKRRALKNAPDEASALRFFQNRSSAKTTPMMRNEKPPHANVSHADGIPSRRTAARPHHERGKLPSPVWGKGRMPP